MTAVGFIKVPDGDTRVFVLRQIEARKLTLKCNGANMSIVRALTETAQDTNAALISASDLLKKQAGLTDSDVVIVWENRTVEVQKQVAFQQPKGQDLGAFNTAYAHLALPYAAGGRADQSTLRGVAFTLTPSEALTRATPEEVAAPAARPLRRGRRSREARCRRWNLWHSQVSRSLVALMQSVAYDFFNMFQTIEISNARVVSRQAMGGLLLVLFLLLCLLLFLPLLLLPLNPFPWLAKSPASTVQHT